MEENWRETYDGLIAGTSKPASLSVEELFELASCLAVSGEFDGKYQVYLMILDHPRAEEWDKDRVVIYHADIQRRNGHAGLALVLLKRIGRPDDRAAILDWLQAIAQCLVMQEDYQSAIAYQRELIGLLDDATPVDLRSYYLQTLAHLKLLAGEADEEAEALLAQMTAMLGHPDFPATKLPYSRKNHLHLLGRWRGEKQDYPAAITALRRAYEIEISPREQAVTALITLYYQLRYGTDIPDWACDMILFLTNHREALQATDRVQYRKYLDFVEQYFPNQKL